MLGERRSDAIKETEFDNRLDDGEDMHAAIDGSQARRPNDHPCA